MTDQELIIQFQNGKAKEDAFTQLLKRHRETVFFQIKKMVLEHADADDIAQAVKKRLKTHSTQNELDHNLEHPSSQDTLKETAIQIKLERAIAELPEKQRFVFMLRYYEDFDYEKIASITGTTVGGAKANYHQAVKKMTTILQAS